MPSLCSLLLKDAEDPTKQQLASPSVIFYDCTIKKPNACIICHLIGHTDECHPWKLLSHGKILTCLVKIMWYWSFNSGSLSTQVSNVKLLFSPLMNVFGGEVIFILQIFIFFIRLAASFTYYITMGSWFPVLISHCLYVHYLDVNCLSCRPSKSPLCPFTICPWFLEY